MVVKNKVKDFFKPTWLKILIFVLLMTIILLYSCLEVFQLGCIQGCVKMPDGSLNCPSCKLCHISDIIPFSLWVVIPIYIFSCFIVWLIELKKKRTKK